ncbi:hypothetical protein [Halosimplex halophilum]|uniref:hypothetical protein n=1 Tax=Halosimplex halophilum TaxID=2559572 RepID=UPI00107FB8CF|nr:hypothetical protein [Halosimplex halophilum]
MAGDDASGASGEDASTSSHPLTTVDGSDRPLVGALLAAAAAVAYAVVLGFAIELPDPAQAATFVLYFGGLGAGVGFTRRRAPTSAGIGVVAFAVVPWVLTWGFGLNRGRPGTALWSAGAIAFGVFLLAFGSESLLRWPSSVRSLLSGRDALAGGAVGAVSAVAVFLSWTSVPTTYGSAWIRGIHYVAVATRGLFLVAAVTAAVLFATRKRTVAPALLVAWAFTVALLGDARGTAVWSATPDYLAEFGVVVLALTLAAGLLELAVRGLLGRFGDFDSIPVGR